MIMFLMLLGIVASGIGYYWYQKETQTGNRYRKRARKIAPTIAEKPMDSDSVLGIKKPMFSNSSDTVANAHAEQIETEEAPAKPAMPPVVLYLMASDGVSFGGYELLQALLSAGLRFGKHQIFHRHEHKDGRGETLFHCASAEKPGTFDPSRMGSFSTCGLCLFFSPDSDVDPLSTFDLMLDTLDLLVDDLGGVVCDEQRQPLTKENMVKCRQKLRDMETDTSTIDMFAEMESAT